jgi:hypothetical protein
MTDPSSAVPPPDARTSPAADFEQQAQGKNPGLVVEFFDFLRHNKKWWLTPIVIVLLLTGLLIALGSSAVAPFIYPLW